MYRRRSRRRLGSPWVGPFSVALKLIKLHTVTSGAISTLFAFPASLFLWRFLDAFSSCLTHATINVQPTSHTTTTIIIIVRLLIVEFDMLPSDVGLSQCNLSPPPIIGGARFKGKYQRTVPPQHPFFCNGRDYYVMQ